MEESESRRWRRVRFKKTRELVNLPHRNGPHGRMGAKIMDAYWGAQKWIREQVGVPFDVSGAVGGGHRVRIQGLACRRRGAPHAPSIEPSLLSPTPPIITIIDPSGLPVPTHGPGGLFNDLELFPRISWGRVRFVVKTIPVQASDDRAFADRLKEADEATRESAEALRRRLDSQARRRYWPAT